MHIKNIIKRLTELNVSANTALTYLSCWSNQLTELNVSANTALTTLWCSSNQLTELNVSANTALTKLNCLYNLLSSLDVSENTALTSLSCGGNNLSNLDVSVNTALTQLFCGENQLTSLDVSENTALTELYCAANQLTSLDVSANTALTELSCGVNQLTSLDVLSNTALTKLHCWINQLTSLDVSANTDLTSLWCRDNQLTSLDVSANTALTELSCYGNSLSTLGVSTNTALTFLWCYNNQLTSLNVANGNNHNFIDNNGGSNPIANSFRATGNENLRCIQVDDVAYSTREWTDKDATAFYSTDCSVTQATTAIPDPNFERKLIGLGYDSGEIDGVVLTANISGITSLDVSSGYNAPNSEKITTLSGIEDFTALTSLACYFNQLTSLDVSVNTTLTILRCFGNQLTSLDVSVNTALTYLRCDGNQLTSLNVSENTALRVLDCGGNQLTSLDVSVNMALTSLDCGGNQLTSLDVSENTALTILRCDGNQLTNLDVSVNTALTILGCGGNQLTSLNVSANTALTILNCSNNELTSLNVANGNNVNFIDNFNGGTAPIANSFKATGNLNLRCIQVDDVAYSTTNWTNKDATAFYSTDCSVTQATTAIPDPNFEQALITLGYDSGEIDGVVLTAIIAGITSLDVSKNSNTPDSDKISDLSGIEAFTALIYLNCNYNQLTSLDVSVNTTLTILRCFGNQLTTLDVLANTALTELYCTRNLLTELNVSANTALTSLTCGGNNLSNLDVSENTALTGLYCGANQLTSLDVSENTALTELYCGANQLTSLDVSENTALTILNCSINQLTNLNVLANTNLTRLECYSNQLSELNVSVNTALTTLYCDRNQLAELNVSENTALTNLRCHNNQLTSLNVANGNNHNFRYFDSSIANSFNATGNPNLRCIQVDDVAYSTANWTNKDATASYSENCITTLSLTTNPASNLTSSSATLNGNITSNGGEAITRKGFVYSTSNTDLTIAGATNVNVSGTGTGVFSKGITGLTASTMYYYTAYATNNNGAVYYGVTQSFSTIPTGTTAIPDPNFEQELIDLGYDSGDIDGVVLTANISGITSLNVPNLVPLINNSNKISNLTGIEAFTSLTYLNCGYNLLTSLDVSKNTALTYLYCDDNQLTTLNVSTNTALTKLSCDRNELTSLNVSGATALRYLYCKDNQLTSLDISSNTALRYLYCKDNQLTSLDISSNTALTILNCSINQLTNLNVLANTALTDLSCEVNQLTTLNVSTNTALTDLSCEVNQLTTLNVSTNTALTDLSCEGNQLTTLNVSTNTALTDLSCSKNELTELNVSKNTALTKLSCRTNLLTELNVSANTALTYLSCYSNDLTSLDVSANTALTSLYCYVNRLTSLDVSANRALTYLDCGNNKLTSLDVSANRALTSLDCNSNDLTSLNVANGNNNNITYSFDATGNPNLACIQVDDVAYSTTNWPKKDATASYSENCITTLSLTTNPASNLTSTTATLNGNIASNGGETIMAKGFVYSTSNTDLTIASATNVDVSGTGTGEFSEGITNLTASTIYYYKAYATNTAGTTYGGEQNFTTSATVTAPAVRTTPASDLTSTTATLNGNITSNGGEAITRKGFVYSTSNTDLTIAGATNVNVSGTGTGVFSGGITGLTPSTTYYYTAYAATNSNRTVYGDVESFSTISTATTAIPDPNFEQALIDLGIDSGDIDGVVLTANISGITSLDILKNPNTPNSDKISDLTGIEAFTSLTALYCGYNQLTTLDISANTALTRLDCYRNELTGLDVSANTALTSLDCRYNDLINLNVANGNNTNFITFQGSFFLSFDATDNPNLSCIQVDDAVWSTDNWTNKDATASYSTDCKDIEIIYPKQNDFYVQGEDITIGFNSIPTFTDVNFTLEYSINNGATWKPTPNINILSNDEINSFILFKWNSQIGRIRKPTSTLIKITANIDGLLIEEISDEFIIQPSNYYYEDYGFRNDGISKIGFPLLGFFNSDGSEIFGWRKYLDLPDSRTHVCLDKYSQDWNFVPAQVECGKNILAPFNGKIIYRTDSYLGKTCGGNQSDIQKGIIIPNAGIHITIQSNQDNTFALSVYHMKSIKSGLEVGDTVIKGKTIIGKVGGSGLGLSDLGKKDAHVHFSLYKNIYGWLQFTNNITNNKTFTIIELLRLGKSFTSKTHVDACNLAQNNFSAEFMFNADNSNDYVYIGNTIINDPTAILLFINNRYISLAGYLAIKNASRKSNKSNEPITSLDGLETLRSIDGNLIISNIDITNLNGLINLIFVGGDVIIENNNQLTDFCGLYKLIKNDGIGGNLIINGNTNNPTENDILNNLNCGQILTINEEVISHNLMLYPNPATNIIKINRSNINKIEVYSLNGRLLKTEINKTEINIKNISKGIYFAKIFSGNKIDIIKFIKK